MFAISVCRERLNIEKIFLICFYSPFSQWTLSCCYYYEIAKEIEVFRGMKWKFFKRFKLDSSNVLNS